VPPPNHFHEEYHHGAERRHHVPGELVHPGLVVDVDCDGVAGGAHSVEVGGHADHAVGAVGHGRGVPLGQPAVVRESTGGDRLVAEIRGSAAQLVGHRGHVGRGIGVQQRGRPRLGRSGRWDEPSDRVYPLTRGTHESDQRPE
jgi:hypothetical protein